MTLQANQLTVAIVWHMHQPYYKDLLTGEYMMPWVRLHAIKDYLDMVAILQEFPNISFTVNIVPSLIEQIEDYTNPDTHDRQSFLTVQEDYTADDKRYILERCFDANAHTKIPLIPQYLDLYERRQHLCHQYGLIQTIPENILNDAFTLQEYADICACMNLVWFDPMWVDSKPELKQFYQQGQNYSLEQRKQIIAIQRDIICEILPTYKSMQETGRLDVTTTPYYHPILPLLVNSEHAHRAMPNATLPIEPFAAPEDAQVQLKMAVEKYREVFGREPVGMWPSEQSVSPEAVDLIKENGFKWFVTDEGNLAKSLGLGRFDKDGLGNFIHPELCCRPYEFHDVKLLFRHLTLSDLIGFHYDRMPPQQAADDMYYKIKDVQQRCHAAGQNYPIVTLALDGENCWENYENDGLTFLRALYYRLSLDDQLSISTISHYFDNLPSLQREQIIRPLPQLHSGSWINSDYHIWIGDPIKNAAWVLLKKTRDDLLYFENQNTYTQDDLKRCWQEIYIAEGSDWFWWYGEPNHSGQDDLFDAQFRLHLANIYRILKEPIPDYLGKPLTQSMGRSFTPPTGPVFATQLADKNQQSLKKVLFESCHWHYAGQYDLAHGAMHKATRLVKSLQYGCDHEAIYLRIKLNSNALLGCEATQRLALYFCNIERTRFNSVIRYKTGSDKVVQSMKWLYAYECEVSHLDSTTPSMRWAESMPDFLWQVRSDIRTLCFHEQSELILVVPFDALGVGPHEKIGFVMMNALDGVIDEFHPGHELLVLERYNAEVVQAFIQKHQLSQEEITLK